MLQGYDLLFCFYTVEVNYWFSIVLFSEMKGSDNGGSKSVYGNEVEIVSDEAVSTSYTASNKVRSFNPLTSKWGLILSVILSRLSPKNSSTGLKFNFPTISILRIEDEVKHWDT